MVYIHANIWGLLMVNVDPYMACIRILWVIWNHKSIFITDFGILLQTFRIRAAWCQASAGPGRPAPKGWLATASWELTGAIQKRLNTMTIKVATLHVQIVQ